MCLEDVAITELLFCLLFPSNICIPPGVSSTRDLLLSIYDHLPIIEHYDIFGCKTLSFRKILNRAVAFRILSCLMPIDTEIIASGSLILYMYKHMKGRTIEKVAGESNEVLGGCIDNIMNKIASIIIIQRMT
jgi:hypothetical protein